MSFICIVTLTKYVLQTLLYICHVKSFMPKKLFAMRWKRNVESLRGEIMMRLINII